MKENFALTSRKYLRVVILIDVLIVRKEFRIKRVSHSFGKENNVYIRSSLKNIENLVR